jgi:glucosamine--fructose-6-phosphate aminotransferase (isomerizing)
MADTLFLQDILTTPQSLRDTLAQVGDQAGEVADALLGRGTRRLVAVGNGSSLYAAAASVYLHNALVGPTGTLAWAVPTGDYSLYPAPLAATDALVGVSVSGEIVDLLDLFERLRGRHQLVGITNVAGSSLTRLVDHLLLMTAGSSVVPTSTKTFVASVAALDLLWLGLLCAQGAPEAARLREELFALPQIVEQSLRQAREQVEEAADNLAQCERLFLFGAGPAYALAQEAALVFKEVANLHAEAAQTREMAQGTTAVVDHAVGVIAVNPPGRGQVVGRQVLAQCAALGAATLEVGAPPAALCIDAQCHELLSPLVYGGPLFMLANELATRHGVDTDHPHWEADYLRTARRSGAPLMMPEHRGEELRSEAEV